MAWSWEFPYASRRSPVIARNVVATSQPLAAQAGLFALREGGNAVDAALTAAIALTVVEPCSNGLGSDLFAIVWDGNDLLGLNGSGRSPRGWSLDYFKQRGMDDGDYAYGWDTVTVPGAVAAWSDLSERLGSLPFERLFVPAIEYAKRGFAVSPLVRERWQQEVESYKGSPSFAQQFLPDGKVPQVGENFRPPHVAETLGSIAASRGESFYRGDLARKIVADAKRNNAAMSEADLAAHSSEWVSPISISYGDVELFELPPNGQGIAALLALGMLKQYGLTQHPVDSADSVHCQIEAMKLAFKDTYAEVADPAYMRVSTADQLLPQRLSRLSKCIDLQAAAPIHGTRAHDGGTVYLSCADKSGMMVSLIQSNYWGFGSGIVVPDTGISLQNRGVGFVFDPDHPNCVAGGKRPFHTIIPGFVMRGGKPLLSFGVMGGHMQAQGHVQIVNRIFDYLQNPQAACDAPRWQLDKDLRVMLEAGTHPQVYEELKKRGHTFSDQQPQFGYGGAQLVYQLDDGVYCAASDPRKDGQAVGF